MKWHEIEKYIPWFFRDNGPSTPFVFKLALTLTTVVKWGQNMMAAYFRVAREHDFGYAYGRLEGSGVEHLSKQDWDAHFLTGLTELGFPKLAKMRHWAVKRFGRRSWNKNGKMMKRMGDVDFPAYLKRKGYPEWEPIGA
jgi:hypothetical protein